ncbi:hypothetical protein SDC9_182215 [bioreactor metagenome]|uniref:Uncharacterized protein n=1 Tax=bioreactor metagenome TaxID=1076179 RepID=A0A645H6S9_9ZZZZ
MLANHDPGSRSSPQPTVAGRYRNRPTGQRLLHLVLAADEARGHERRQDAALCLGDVGQHGGGHDLHEVGVALLHRLDAARPGGAVGDEDLLHGQQPGLVGALDGGHARGQQAAGAQVHEVVHAALVGRDAVAAVDVDDGDLARPGDGGDHRAQAAQFDVGDDGDFGLAGQQRVHLLGPVKGGDDGAARQPRTQGVVRAAHVRGPAPACRG